MRCRPTTFASIADRQAAQQPEQQHRQELTENSMSPDAEQVWRHGTLSASAAEFCLTGLSVSRSIPSKTVVLGPKDREYITSLIKSLLKQCNTRCYLNVRSKATMSQLNLPHGTDNQKVFKKQKKTKSRKHVTVNGSCWFWFRCAFLVNFIGFIKLFAILTLLLLPVVIAALLEVLVCV